MMPAGSGASLIRSPSLHTIVVGTFATALATKLDGLRIPPDVRAALTAQAARLIEAQVPPQADEPTRRLLEQAVTDAFVHTFRVVMLVCASLALISALCAAATPTPVGSNKHSS